MPDRPDIPAGERAAIEREDANRSLSKMRDRALEGNLGVESDHLRRKGAEEERARLDVEAVAKRLYELVRGEHHSALKVAHGSESWESRDETVKDSWRDEARRILALASQGGDASV